MVTSIFQLPPISVDETRSSPPGRVDLWCFFYEEIKESDLTDSYYALMTSEEQARHHRFYFARDRLLFLATRALVRTVLSAYADVSPQDWRFSAQDRVKPFIKSPTVLPALHFNLSNTYGLVVCAVSVTHPSLGVDAESIDRPGETISIADQYFSAQETRSLRALPPTVQRERFFSYWTLKESYIKARGLGLAIPLEQFTFLLDRGPEIGVAFHPPLRDDPSRWRFSLLRASPRHLVAVGVDSGGAALSLRASTFVPLCGVVPFHLEGP